MKNRISALAIGVIALASMSAMAQENRKAASARKEVRSAKNQLKEAKIDSAADFQKFKNEAEIKIHENEVKIGELKAKKSGGTIEAKNKYNKAVVALETKNNDLKKKIKSADDTKTSRWRAFKNAFNHDMKELEAAIKRI